MHLVGTYRVRKEGYAGCHACPWHFSVGTTVLDGLAHECCICAEGGLSQFHHVSPGSHHRQGWAEDTGLHKARLSQLGRCMSQSLDRITTRLPQDPIRSINVQLEAPQGDKRGNRAPMKGSNCMSPYLSNAGPCWFMN